MIVDGSVGENRCAGRFMLQGAVQPALICYLTLDHEFIIAQQCPRVKTRFAPICVTVNEQLPIALRFELFVPRLPLRRRSLRRVFNLVRLARDRSVRRRDVTTSRRRTGRVPQRFLRCTRILSGAPNPSAAIRRWFGSPLPRHREAERRFVLTSHNACNAK